MAEGKGSGSSNGGRVAAERVLLVLIVPTPGVMDELATALVDIGAPGTVLESKGLMSIMREEMPIFGGLASMLPETTGSKVVLSLTTRSVAGEVMEMLEREFNATDRPIGVAVPAALTGGLREPAR